MSRVFPLISSDKPLGGRYQLINQLGSGGFGRTFLAEDLHLPGHPRCVIKQLKPQVKSNEARKMAWRCFNTEAQVLYQLGSHDQIPRLLAHFEEGQEFYLAQEFIEGSPVIQDLVEGKPWTQGQVVAFLKNILEVLSFVHQKQVIHRDIKPSNLIRRKSDGKVVLIDFGAVKQVGSQSFDPNSGFTNLTISIGTKGYMPNEQLAGKPRFSSDIYAVGIMAVQALTGVLPRNFEEDPRGEVAWRSHAQSIHPELIKFLDRMVRYDFRERFSTATEALAAINHLPESLLKEAENGFKPITSDFRIFTSAAPDLGIAPRPVQWGVSDGYGHYNRSYGTPETNRPIGNPREAQAREDYGQAAGGGVQPDQGNIDDFNPDFNPDLNPDLNTTAIWHPQQSEIPAVLPARDASALGLSAASLDPHSLDSSSLTHLETQAIGRPNPGDISEGTVVSTELTQAKSRQRFKWWLSFAAMTILGTGIAAVQNFLPEQSAANLSGADGSTANITAALAEGNNGKPLTNQEKAVKLSQEAAKLRQAAQGEAALKLYDQAIELQPNLAEAYAGRCETLNQLKRPEAAIVSCADALAYKPNYPEALWSKGNALMLLDRTIEALKLYEEVTERKPSFASGWVRRGVALQKLGRSVEAIAALDQAIGLYRNSAEAWKTKGAALITLERYDEAIVTLDKALQLQPDDPTATQLREAARAKLR